MRGQIFLFSSASVALAPIMQTGPPVTVGRPTAVSVTTTSISLEWPATTECVSAAPFASLPCNASLYKLQAKKTHYSSDFPVESPAWGRIIYSTSSAVVFGGLDDMSTYAVRIAARRTFDAAFGAWSESEFAKLTGGAPTLQAALLPIGESLYNDRVLLRWQSDVNPKQADRFYVSFGLDLDSMRDFRDEDGARRVLMDADVCTVVPAENLQRCEVFVTGLELRTIFLFKVYSGNINGFETRGSAPRIAATLAMPVAPATNVTLGNISLSGNASDFGVELTWLRPVGFPAVNRFYVAASVSGGPFRRVTDVIRATGSGREVSAFVGALLKGRVYRLRVHSGNSEGPSGFHVDPEADPTRSEEVELVPDGVPGRVLVTAAAPSVPDMNSMMAVTWDPPNAGAAATHYTLAYRACGAAPAAVCAPSCQSSTICATLASDRSEATLIDINVWEPQFVMLKDDSSLTRKGVRYCLRGCCRMIPHRSSASIKRSGAFGAACCCALDVSPNVRHVGALLLNRRRRCEHKRCYLRP